MNRRISTQSTHPIVNYVASYCIQLEASLHTFTRYQRYALLMAQEFQILGMLLLSLYDMEGTIAEFNILDAFYIISKVSRPYQLIKNKQLFIFQIGYIVPLFITLLSILIWIYSYYQFKKQSQSIYAFIVTKSNFQQIMHVCNIIHSAVFMTVLFIPYSQITVISIYQSVINDTFTASNLVNCIFSIMTTLLIMAYTIFIMQFTQESISLKITNFKLIQVPSLEYFTFILKIAMIFVNSWPYKGEGVFYTQTVLYLILSIFELQQYLMLNNQALETLKFRLNLKGFGITVALVQFIFKMMEQYEVNDIICQILLLAPITMIILQHLKSVQFDRFLYNAKSQANIQSIQYQLIQYYTVFDKDQSHYLFTITVFFSQHRNNCNDYNCPCDQPMSKKNTMSFYVIKLTQLLGQLINQLENNKQKQKYCTHYIGALNEINQQVRAYQYANLILSKNMNKESNNSYKDGLTIGSEQTLTQNQSFDEAGNLKVKNIRKHYHFERLHISELSYIRTHLLLIILEQTKQKLVQGFDVNSSDNKYQLSQSIQLYLKIEEQNHQLKYTITSILNKKKDLFIMITSPQNVSPSHLVSLCLELIRKVQNMDKQLNELFQEFPSRKMQSINSFYQAEIVNNYLQAYKIINYNTISENALIKIQKNQAIDLLSYKSNYLITCMDHQGIALSIKHRSQNVHKIFNYDQQTFNEFKTINSLLPFGFQTIHRQLVEEFLINGTSKYFRQKGINFGLTKSKYLQTIEFFFDFDFNKLQELTFQVFIYEVQCSSSFIIINQKQQILGITKELCLQLDIPQDNYHLIPQAVQEVGITNFIPSFAQLQATIATGSSVANVSIPFQVSDDFYQVSSTQLIQSKQKYSQSVVKYVCDIVITVNKYYSVIEIKNLYKQQQNSITIELISDNGSSQNFPRTLDLDISQEQVMPCPNEYNMEIFNKIYGQNQEEDQPQIQLFKRIYNNDDNTITPQHGMDQLGQSSQDQNIFSPIQSGKAFIERTIRDQQESKYGKKITTPYMDYSINQSNTKNNIQQRFFKPNQTNAQYQKSVSSKENYMINQQMGDKVQNQDLKENLREQLANDGHTSVQQEQKFDHNEASSTFGTFTQNLKLFKKYELIVQLLESQTFSTYFDLMLASFCIMSSVIVIFAILLMSNSSSDVSRAVKEISLLDFQGSIMNPIYQCLSSFTALLNYQLLSQLSNQQNNEQQGIVKYYLNNSYSVLKENNIELQKNTYLNDFFTDKNINIQQIDNNSLVENIISFRIAMFVLLEQHLEFTKLLNANFTELDTKSTFINYYLLNYQQYDNQTKSLNDNVVNYLTESTVLMQKKWILLCVRCIYLVMFFQLAAWLLFLKYQRKYIKILKLFFKVDYVWVYRDIERYKELLGLMMKDSNIVFRYKFNLESKERFFGAEQNRKQQLADKLDKGGLMKRKKISKLQFARVNSFIPFALIFGLYFTYAFTLNMNGIDYLDKYQLSAQYFSQISNLQFVLPELYAIREINYFHSEGNPLFQYFQQGNRETNIIQFEAGLDSITQFLLVITLMDQKLIQFTEKLRGMNEIDICTYMDAPLLVYQQQCDGFQEGTMVRGIQVVLTKIRDQLSLELNSSDQFMTREGLTSNEIEIGLVTSTAIQYLKDDVKSALVDDADWLNQTIQVISVLFIIWTLLLMFISLALLRPYYYQQFQNMKKCLILLPQPALFADDVFERQVRQLIAKEYLV